MSFNFLTQGPLSLDNCRQRLLWLVKLRLIALGLQLPLTFVGRYYGYLNQATHILFMILLIVLLSWSIHLYRKLTTDSTYSVTELKLTFHAVFDLFIFTVLLSISGSSNNPFYAFFYVLAVLGGIFTAGKRSHLFGLALMLCVFFVQIQPGLSHKEALGIIFHPQTFPWLLAQLAIPLVTYLIARSFGTFLNSNQERLLALTLKNERLDRLRALGSLSAGFSHEFASPLQNAKLRLKRISHSEKASVDDVSECMESIKDCEKVLRKMNLSQLTFSEQDFESVPLKTITHETLETWKEGHQDISVSFIPENGTVKVNKINFVQVLLNILDNAGEASGNHGKMKISMKKENAFLVLSIEDTGPGFKQEILDRLGEPFNTDKPKGTGLGLYSSYLFMSSVGGHLTVRNIPQRGAQIELHFPMARDV